MLEKLNGYLELHEQLNEQDCSIDNSPQIPTSFWNNIQFQFKHDILPGLCKKVVLLCSVLDHLIKDLSSLDSLLQEVCNIIFQVDELLKLAMSSVASVLEPCHKQATWDADSITRKCDGFEGLLYLAWLSLCWGVGALTEDLSTKFSSFEALLEILVSPTDLNKNSDSTHKEKLVHDILLITTQIDELDETLARSDFHIYCHVNSIWGWSTKADDIYRILMMLIKQGSHVYSLSHQHLTAAISIMKLSRLFINKMTKLTNSEHHPASFMNSSDLACLHEALDNITDPISELICPVGSSFSPTRHTLPANLPALMMEVVKSFEKPIEVLNRVFGSNAHAHKPDIKKA